MTTTRKRKENGIEKKKEVVKSNVSPEAQKKVDEFYNNQKELLQKFDEDQKTIGKPLQKTAVKLYY